MSITIQRRGIGSQSAGYSSVDGFVTWVIKPSAAIPESFIQIVSVQGAKQSLESIAGRRQAMVSIQGDFGSGGDVEVLD